MSEAITRHIRYVFLDVVGFTLNRSVEAQADVVAVLNGIVSQSISDSGLGEEDIILLPTGDGICIAIINPMANYDIHVQVALNILQNIFEHYEQTKDEMRRFQVRIGLNENVDNLISDINKRQNVAGAGINMASRVMGLADAGQVMVSVSVYETLIHRERYMDAFKPFKATIKHEHTINVYQFVQPGHKGLNIEVPQAFVKKTQVEPRLSQLEAYYFANSLKYRSFLISQMDSGIFDYASMVLLWFLSLDCRGVANQTQIDPYKPCIYGKGKKTIEECSEYYCSVDFWLIAEMAGFIEKSLAHLKKYFESTVFLFINKEGADKLANEHPKLWKEFGLDDIA